jgi:hypothetical protein
MLERHLFTALLAGTAIVALAMAFRLGMGLVGIYSLLRSEGEGVVITLIAVLSLGLLVLGMAAVALADVRLWPGRRGR